MVCLLLLDMNDNRHFTKKLYKPVVDLNVIKKCKLKDPEAQQIIYQTLAPKMFGICLRYMGQSDQAKDVMQDAFIHLFDKVNDFRGDGSFEGWARRIFVTMCLGAIRKRKSIRELTDGEEQLIRMPSQTPNVLSTIHQNDILTYIAKLPTTYRTILNLYSIEGYSHQEIAQELGITIENSRVQLLRAKNRLAQYLIQAGVLTEDEI